MMLQLKPDRLGIDDFVEQAITVCGKSFRADMSGALYWPAERALIVADLHLEKGSAFAERGQMFGAGALELIQDRLLDCVGRSGTGAVRYRR